MQTSNPTALENSALHKQIEVLKQDNANLQQHKANLQQNLAYYHNCIKEHMLSQDTYDQKSTV